MTLLCRVAKATLFNKLDLSCLTFYFLNSLVHVIRNILVGANYFYKIGEFHRGGGAFFESCQVEKNTEEKDSSFLLFCSLDILVQRSNQ